MSYDQTVRRTPGWIRVGIKRWELSGQESKHAQDLLFCFYEHYFPLLRYYRSAPIGVWEIKLEIMTMTDRLTDRPGHRKVSLPITISKRSMEVSLEIITNRPTNRPSDRQRTDPVPVSLPTTIYPFQHSFSTYCSIIFTVETKSKKKRG